MVPCTTTTGNRLSHPGLPLVGSHQEWSPQEKHISEEMGALSGELRDNWQWVSTPAQLSLGVPVVGLPSFSVSPASSSQGHGTTFSDKLSSNILLHFPDGEAGSKVISKTPGGSSQQIFVGII